MRLITDPQPAIEWFCTGGSVCIGMEEERRDAESAGAPRIRSVAPFKRPARPVRPVRFPVAKGEA